MVVGTNTLKVVLSERDPIKNMERNSFEKSEEFVRLAPTFTIVSFVNLYERSENER
jgi:hypothetical protein